MNRSSSFRTWRPGLRAIIAIHNTQASETMAALAVAGISIDAVATQLLDEGIQLFAKAFDKLLDAIDRTLTFLPAERPHPSSHRMSDIGDLEELTCSASSSSCEL